MIVVLFGTQLRADADLAHYRDRSRRMNDLVRQMPGFISLKSYTSDEGDEVVMARFESREALDAWRFHPEHMEAQRLGREAFYQSYWVQACETFRDYTFQRDTSD